MHGLLEQRQHTCQLVNCILPLPFFSLIIGRDDQGGWEEEVITMRLRASRRGIISGDNSAAGDTTLRAVGFLPRQVAAGITRLLTSSCGTTCTHRNTALCWNTEPQQIQTRRGKRVCLHRRYTGNIIKTTKSRFPDKTQRPD